MNNNQELIELIQATLLPKQTRPRGRPSKYATEEERIEAKKLQRKESYQRMKQQRIELANNLIKMLQTPTAKPSRSRKSVSSPADKSSAADE